jgi:predicted nucleic acid-binding protein
MSNKVFELYTNPSISSDIRDGINELVQEEFIKIEEIRLNTDEFDIYYSLINDGETDRYIGKGEASTIALAVKHKAIVLCNDCKNVGFYLEKYSLKSLNTADIIKRAYQKKIITRDDAEEIWGQMKKQGTAAEKGFDISPVFGNQMPDLFDLPGLSTGPFNDRVQKNAPFRRNY